MEFPAYYEQHHGLLMISNGKNTKVGAIDVIKGEYIDIAVIHH